MPGAWHTTWPMRGGRFAKNGIERFLAGEDDAEAQEREQLIHTFGNLTLLTQPLNSSVGNGSYQDKQPAIVEQSTLVSNRYFFDIPQWDVDEIRARGRWQFDSARRIWRRPSNPQ